MKNFYTSFLLLLLIIITGCSDDDQTPAGVRITISVDNIKTRATFQEQDGTYTVKLAEADDIVLIGRSGTLLAKCRVHIEDDGTAILSTDGTQLTMDDFLGEDIYAFYTDGLSYSVQGDVISFDYPSYVRGGKQDVLWGIGKPTSTGIHFQMRYLCPLMRISVPVSHFDLLEIYNTCMPSFDMKTNCYVGKNKNIYSGALVIKDGNYVFYGVPGYETCVYCKYDNKFYGPLYPFESATDDIEPGTLYNVDLLKLVMAREQEEAYESTDFSEDGKVVQLQKATVGKGIDLVFIGYGFVDKHMNPDGKYERRIKNEVERFFDIEPYKTFRNRFNVYMVKVVSKTCLWEGGSGSDKNPPISKAFSYADKIPGLDVARVSIVHNNDFDNNKEWARSFCNWFDDGSFVSYLFYDEPGLVNHESGGHGFAHLGDEYVESGNEYKRFTDYEWLDNYHRAGFKLNIDYNRDSSTVLWSRFLQDPRYAGERLGVYEGAFEAGFWLYRPSVTSMMRDHHVKDAVFNAPSREQIYKQIMKYSEGYDWVYDYEAFVAYDAINRNYNNDAVTRSTNVYDDLLEESRMNTKHRAPVHMEGSWRDYLK